jgi:hypothetical protein
MSAIAIYREDTLAARIQRDHLVTARDAALARSGGAARTFAWRIARIAGGAVLTVLGSTLWLGTLAAISFWPALDSSVTEKLVVLAIPGAWLAALVAAAIARQVAAATVARAYARFVAGDDPFRDLGRLQALAPVATLPARAEALERASVAWPLVGLSLLAPISIHALVALPLGVGWKFAEWIGLSVVIVGPAHLALAACAWLYARALARRQARLSSGWSAVWVATGVSMVPFALLMMISPILVLATGALFVPYAWSRIRRAVEAERRSIAVAG